jgi:hypothetical protein
MDLLQRGDLETSLEAGEVESLVLSHIPEAPGAVEDRGGG